MNSANSINQVASNTQNSNTAFVTPLMLKLRNTLSDKKALQETKEDLLVMLDSL